MKTEMLKNPFGYIIALDLDETLLDSNGNITSFTLEMLKYCKKQECIIVISSTRGYGTCKEIAKKIGADYVCCQAGNMIVDSDGNIIYKNGFSSEDVASFINKFKFYTNNFVMDSDEDLFCTVSDEFSKNWGAKYCQLDSLCEKNIYKMCIYYQKGYTKQIEDYCKEKNYVCREMRTAPFMLVTPSKSDKFYALKKLIDILGLNLDKLMVFGDDHSDLLSIQKAKYGVAVNNARKDVLKEAKYVTKSNDEEGVALFLKEFFDK